MNYASNLLEAEISLADKMSSEQKIKWSVVRSSLRREWHRINFCAMFLPLFILCVVMLENCHMSCFVCIDQNTMCKPNSNFHSFWNDILLLVRLCTGLLCTTPLESSDQFYQELIWIILNPALTNSAVIKWPIFNFSKKIVCFWHLILHLSWLLFWVMRQLKNL